MEEEVWLGDNERTALIGWHRPGASDHQIALLMGISESYVRIIIENYLKMSKKINLWGLWLTII